MMALRIAILASVLLWTVFLMWLAVWLLTPSQPEPVQLTGVHQTTHGVKWGAS